MEASPEEVFRALLDPYQYPNWVVGAKELRDVDPQWPEVGSAFYHRLGTEVTDIKDKSEILELEIPHRIVLRTFARPLGIARVTISARPAEDGTIVSIKEVPEEGTKLKKITPLLDPLVHVRNIEALRRLERIVRILASRPVK
jgi:uncharacterized protein YndB with AHSA1/START domain